MALSKLLVDYNRCGPVAQWLAEQFIHRLAENTHQGDFTDERDWQTEAIAELLDFGAYSLAHQRRTDQYLRNARDITPAAPPVGKADTLPIAMEREMVVAHPADTKCPYCTAERQSRPQGVAKHLVASSQGEAQ